MNYLVDTDWIIHGLHGKEKEVTKLLELKKEGLAISVISLAELLTILLNLELDRDCNS